MILSPLHHYEIVADAFHRMTGIMAPGKDEPACGVSAHSYEERRDAYESWHTENGATVEAVLRSVCAVMPDEQERGQDEPGEPRDWNQPTLEAFVENNYWHNPEDAIGDIRLYISKHKQA